MSVDVVRVQILFGQPDEPMSFRSDVKIRRMNSDTLEDLPEDVVFPKLFGGTAVKAQCVPENGNPNGFKHYHLEPETLAPVITCLETRQAFLESCRKSEIAVVVFGRSQVLLHEV